MKHIYLTAAGTDSPKNTIKPQTQQNSRSAALGFKKMSFELITPNYSRELFVKCQQVASTTVAN